MMAEMNSNPYADSPVAYKAKTITIRQIRNCTPHILEMLDIDI